jgi:hypothetical protein
MIDYMNRDKRSRFGIKLTQRQSEGTFASVMDLNSIFVVFILVEVGLIIHGVLMIKKRDIEQDRYHPKDK